jgi:uncharacterized protein YbjT (DUF2867 family)
MQRRNVLLIFLSLLDVAFAFVAPSKRTLPLVPSTRCRRPYAPPLFLSKQDKNNEDAPKKKKKKPPVKKKKPVDEQKKKEQRVAKVAAEFAKDKPPEEEKQGILKMLDPFRAGKKFRKTVEALTGTLSQERRSMYYVDDRFNEPLFSERNPLLERMEDDAYAPEVLVIGATGEVGRLVVRRLLLEGKFRVRVLVRDLYSKTLNLLGTGVTYCQGDLANVESLEYALTDVDKIVFCAGAPRPDESDFTTKFQAYCQENIDNCMVPEKTRSDSEWDQLEGVLQVRAKLAEQVDCIGMQNLVRAYQNVRHADYGTSQAAKRSLFKFQDRPEDFNLFSLEEEQEDTLDESPKKVVSDVMKKTYSSGYQEEDEEDAYEDTYADYEDDEYHDEEYAAATVRKGAAVKTQCQWIRNMFEHGVFVGKVPKQINGLGGEATIVSSRLRSREEPEKGIDLSNGFAGFVCRVCSDGGTYEAFVRCGNYGTDRIEYVCEFSTETKPQRQGNKSRNKFKTVRLPFENFKPVSRREISGNDETVVPPFKGSDVRRLGFRYRSESNPEKAKFQKGDLSSFYLAFSYIKVYRSQLEPEFVYLSDSRIPSVIRSNMVRHDVHQIVTAHDDDDDSYKLLDQAALTSVTGNPTGRSTEETYFKYRGEEILKSSGLSYTIVRVSGFNELQSGEASTIDLTQSNDEVLPVSRAEVAQVCASALLDPNALNKSLYVSKAKRKSNNLSREEDMSSKFSQLQADPAR